MGIACDRATVAAAVAAASPGDTITINAGTATWASAISIDKQLTIIGDGSSNTVITDWGFSVADGIDNWRISGIGWENNSLTALQFPLSFGGYLSADGCRNLRVDHCSFSGYQRPVDAEGISTGVIDNCTFSGLGADGIRIRAAQASSWASEVVFGTAAALFFEDCTFDNAGADTNIMIIHDFGSNIVIRYCEFNEDPTATDDTACFIDFHGFGHGVDCRGAHSYEVYNNTFKRGITSYPYGINCRAGSGVIWGNVFDDNGQTGRFNPDVLLQEYRALHGNGITADYQWADTQEGYPAIDQIGRSADIAGDRTNQTAKGLYIWSNEDGNGGPIDITVPTTEYNDDYIVLNRDYFTTMPSGYSPYQYPHPLRRSKGYVSMLFT